MAGSAQAATIVNGSFEQGIAPGGFTGVNGGDSTSITGWLVLQRVGAGLLRLPERPC